MKRALWLLGFVIGCDADDRWPNPDHLTVSAEDGVPVFSWRARDADRFQVVGEGGTVLWDVVPIGDPPACVDQLFAENGLTWLEPPAPYETMVFVGRSEPPATLPAGEGYEATLSVCLGWEGGTGSYDTSTVYFDVLPNGEVAIDCDASICGSE